MGRTRHKPVGTVERGEFVAAMRRLSVVVTAMVGVGWGFGLVSDGFAIGLWLIVMLIHSLRIAAQYVYGISLTRQASALMLVEGYAEVLSALDRESGLADQLNVDPVVVERLLTLSPHHRDGVRQVLRFTAVHDRSPSRTIDIVIAFMLFLMSMLLPFLLERIAT